MRKESIISLVVYGLGIIAAALVLIFVLSGTTGKYLPAAFDGFFLSRLFVFICIVIAIIFNAAMLEIFHVLGAKYGGYNVVLVNILFFCFEKKEGKWHFAFKDFDGLFGETKIIPGKKEKKDLKPYIFFPIFGWAIEIASCIVLYTQLVQTDVDFSVQWLTIPAIIFITISSVMALFNLIPLKLDTMTDGYRLYLFSKKENVEAYNELLRVDELERNGSEVKDVKVFTEITEFTAELNLISIYQHLNNHKYDEAEKLIDLILANPTKIDPITQKRLIAQKLFVELMSKTVEDAKKVYEELADDNVRRFIANDISMESVRSYVLIAAFIEQSRGEFEIAKSKLEKARKRVLPSRLVIENKLYDESVQKVLKVHPEWQEENTAE